MSMQKVECLINQIAHLDWLIGAETGSTLMTYAAHIPTTTAQYWRSVAAGLINSEALDGIINDLECDLEYSAGRLQMAYIVSEAAA